MLGPCTGLAWHLTIEPCSPSLGTGWSRAGTASQAHAVPPCQVGVLPALLTVQMSLPGGLTLGCLVCWWHLLDLLLALQQEQKHFLQELCQAPKPLKSLLVLVHLILVQFLCAIG